ncbi:MAG: hypothetical protein GFH27_549305n1, partial [Chloroflexi bacterium AL-W]|nr:hypothetical protein [Chloroflexi bacterium AL-N1]NOK69247.1 hypothetical protein [Chloroflexi bacterium AL-N10]NOK76308.1 hypothetical protein [Chloroflexi bacterium AL-N5]NOK83425.1 hypothetical protein [Chloroflexi bacterium AL-W]NOK91085.1 hypothetical protein [Chloroflexi bacterium AL-N15]
GRNSTTATNNLPYQVNNALGVGQAAPIPLASSAHYTMATWCISEHAGIILISVRLHPATRLRALTRSPIVCTRISMRTATPSS